MRPEERDAAYLWDMLDAARAIVGFVAEVRFGQAPLTAQPLSRRRIERVGAALLAPKR